MMNEKGPTIYNQAKLYKDSIYPLISEIKKICKINKIPFMCTCAVANTSEGTVYRHDGVPTGSLEVNLCDDQFERLLCVMNGFDVRPMNAVTELSDEAIDYIDDIDLPDEEEPESPNTTSNISSSSMVHNEDSALVFDGEL